MRGESWPSGRGECSEWWPMLAVGADGIQRVVTTPVPQGRGHTAIGGGVVRRRRSRRRCSCRFLSSPSNPSAYSPTPPLRHWEAGGTWPRRGRGVADTQHHLLLSKPTRRGEEMGEGISNDGVWEDTARRVAPPPLCISSPLPF